MRNAECGIVSQLSIFRIPHSAFRIPHSAFSTSVLARKGYLTGQPGASIMSRNRLPHWELFMPLPQNLSNAEAESFSAPPIPPDAHSVDAGDIAAFADTIKRA